MPSGCMAFILDFNKAFNHLHRDAILGAVHHNIPKLYGYCYLSYKSFLFFRHHTIMSQEGTWQGDPLGPLLFWLSVQSLWSPRHSWPWLIGRFHHWWIQNGCAAWPGGDYSWGRSHQTSPQHIKVWNSPQTRACRFIRTPEIFHPHPITRCFTVRCTSVHQQCP